MSSETQADQGAGGNRPLPERETASRDLAGLAIAAGLFALAILIWRDAASYPERRTYAQFGPEIFPYLVAAGTAVFAALTALMAWRGGFPARETMNWPPVIWVVMAVVAEIVLLTADLGFILASGTLFGFAARGMGRKPVWLTVAVGIGVSLLLYILFRHGLGLSLPDGPLERIVDAPFRN